MIRSRSKYAILTSVFSVIFVVSGWGQSPDGSIVGKQTPPMGWEPWNIDHCGASSKWDEDYYNGMRTITKSSPIFLSAPDCEILDTDISRSNAAIITAIRTGIFNLAETNSPMDSSQLRITFTGRD